jgi:alkanesulfonate monooxygenase SsuD/methylene tetrahydromethanopterin reductase-like flavin-dependent oxidoreductase (luciferase family)
MELTPKPLQNPIPFYVACFSENSLAMAARKNLNIIYAPFAANMVFGGLDKAVGDYRAACESHGHAPGRAMCSYFVHIAQTPAEEDYGRTGLISYFKNCVLRAIPSDPSKAPPTMQYFMKMHENLSKVKKEDLTDKSILIGTPDQITETLKRVEASGIEEVILYFNVGQKPHGMVKDQMAKFMEEVAPNFAGKHNPAAT